MATSRTSTTTWKRIAKQAKKQARERGQTHCLYCPRILNYDVAGLPNSAEADHTIAHNKGGKDSLANCQIICRHCNGSKGNRDAPKTVAIIAQKPLRTSRKW